MNNNISDSVKYIGVDDTTIDLFESQYVVPEGVSYNSYVILDEKTAVEGIPIPFHDGAAAYYKQYGITVNTEKGSN